MAGTNVGKRGRRPAEQWRERIAEHGQSGLSVKQFCEQRGLTPWCFYKWRKRLRDCGPVRFALVDRAASRQDCGMGADLEVVLASGERLRVWSGADPATLRTVLQAMRG